MSNWFYDELEELSAEVIECALHFVVGNDRSWPDNVYYCTTREEANWLVEALNRADTDPSND